MISNSIVEKIFELDRLARENVSSFEKKRFFYEELKPNLDKNIFIGIAGLRGVGKTILLRQLSLELQNSIYISLDSLEPNIDLFELVKELSERLKIKFFLLDEIHYRSDWQASLKKIFDFLSVKLVFTSSAGIDVVQSKSDLSRRVLVLNMPPFSFREFLFFKKNTLIEKLELEELLKSNDFYSKIISFESYFYEFCTGGALPCYLESTSKQIIENIVERILNNDLPAFEKLSREDIDNIKKIMNFIGKSSVEVCGYSSISKNVGVSKYEVKKYLSLLEKTFILQIIFPFGSNVLKEPKILFTLPFRAIFSFEDSKLVGALREEFFVQHVSHLNTINYIKSVRGEKLPDYLVYLNKKKLIFEIGGAGKTKKQLKNVTGERFVVSQPWGKGIPLLSFGFLF